MTKLNGNRLGLTFGIFAALLHALWAVVIALGLGESFLNLIFPLHFLNNVYQVMPFSLINAVILTVCAFIGGYVLGWLGVLVWGLSGKCCK